MESTPCLLASNRFFECAHPFFEKSMVITKRTAIRPEFQTFQMMNGNMHELAEHLTFLSERNLLYTRIVMMQSTCPDHLLNSPSSLDTSVSAAWMVSCALSNSIFSCVAS